jgi:hypothetical protein
MRQVWVDSHTDPDFAKARRHGIDGFYFDIFDERVDPALFQSLVDQGYKVGVYFASNWGEFHGMSGAEIADAVVKRLKDVFGKKLKAEFPRVQADMEEHDPDKIIDFLRQFRFKLKWQALSWTMEGFQGGWMSDAFVAEVVKHRVRVVPQAYTGDMRNMASDQVLRDLMARGFHENIISIFYDAREIDQLIGADGFFFTQQRLP